MSLSPSPDADSLRAMLADLGVALNAEAARAVAGHWAVIAAFHADISRPEPPVPDEAQAG